jgi:hypothetical protein
MCGSLHSGTVDHLIPRTAFPEFTVLSLNLVPACVCNSKRGATSVGPNPGERILHPYFDDCLAERLLKARFTDLAAVPRTDLVLTSLAARRPDASAIRFHVANVVSRTGIFNYLADRWVALCSRPVTVFRFLEHPIGSRDELRILIRKEVSYLDALHGDSKNNWNSIFTMGILDRHVVNWLWSRISVVGRDPHSPLVPQ